MIRTLLLTTVAAVLMAGPVLAQSADAAGEAQARRILERTPLIDGHNDLPWALRQEHGNDPHAVDLTTNLEASTDLHTDIPRLRAGGMGGQFWSVYVPATMTPPDAAVATFERAFGIPVLSVTCLDDLMQFIDSDAPSVAALRPHRQAMLDYRSRYGA